MGTATPSAICGSRPIVTNSAVPIANPPMASAITARPKWVAQRLVDSSGRTLVVADISGPNVGPGAPIPDNDGDPGLIVPDHPSSAPRRGQTSRPARASLNVAEGR